MIPPSMDTSHLARLGRVALFLGLVHAATHRVAQGQIAPPPVAFAVSAWTTAEGIPQSSVSGLALDDDGYLWLGTLLGLSRFDGDTFVTYARSRASDPSDTAMKGRLGSWMLWPVEGLARVLPGSRPERALVDSNLPIYHLAVGPADTVWVGTLFEVRRLEGRRWAPVGGVPDSAVGEVRTVRLGPRGELWVGGTRGLVRLSRGRPRTASRVRLRCEQVADVAGGQDGGTWVATCAGVEWLSPDGGPARVVVPRGYGPSPLRLHLEPGDSALWVADAEGVRRFRVARDPRGAWQLLRNFEHSLDLGGALPNAMIGDSAGGVWIGTGGAGLRHVRRLAARRLSVADGLPDRPVHHLASDGADGLWIGNCGGLARWRAGALEVVRPSEFGLPDRCVRGLLREPDGTLWIGQLNALVRRDAAGRASVPYRSLRQPDRDVSPILRDRRGRVWFASSAGDVGHFAAPDSAAVMLPRGVLPTTKVASMVEDARGGIWIGQTGVVTRLEDTTRTLQLTVADGVPDAPIRALVFDADSALWMASYGAGLARYDVQRGVRRLPPRGRQFEQLLSALRIDRRDRLWLLGDGGIMVLARSEVNEAITGGRPVRGAVDIGAGQGVPEGNGGFPNTWYDAAGEQWWVATVDGAASVGTEASPGEVRPLHVRIDDVRLDGVSRGRPDTLRMPPSANALEVRFSSPSFGAADLARIRYRLRGHDREWLEAGTSRIARYAGVPPGRYVFDVRIERNFGSPAAETRSLPVTVEPWWWQTPLARLLAMALGVAAVWGLFRWRTRLIRERNRALQEEIADRERTERQAAEAARELAHLSRLATAGELATSIAHELNQPLTAVMGNAQQARHLAASSDDENLRLTLDAVVDQSERAADVIRSLRAFVLKQQEWDPDVRPDAVIEDTLRLLRPELSGRSVAVQVRDERFRRGGVQGSAVQLQQVLANLLLNAADAMAEQPPDRRRATIVLRDEGPDAVRLSVADTGPGIPAGMLAEIFQPFFTTKPSGLGLGLSLSRSIVEAHAGRLDAEAPPEGGSVFHIVLPLAKP